MSLDLATIVRNEIDERIRPAQGQNTLVTDVRGMQKEASRNQVNLSRSGPDGEIILAGIYSHRRYGQACYGTAE